jgi:hypothetical protein
MNKKFLFIFIILILIAGLIFVIYEYQRSSRVCFKNNCFEVELAITKEEKILGLMFRKSLGRNKGMLFVFNEEGIYPFWMKNTLIPLDIIWISSNNEVVFISENTQPCKEDSCFSITPTQKAKYVLEINAGVSKEIGLKIGDKLEININKR